jgi:hypothetical protein
MKIESSRVRHPQPAVREKQSKEKITLPRDLCEIGPANEGTDVGRLLIGAAKGGVGGAALGGLAGVVGIMATGFKDVVYQTMTETNEYVALTAAVAGLAGAGIGALMSGIAQRDEVKERNSLREFCAANEVRPETSPTFQDWKSINEAGWTERETVPETAKPALTNILGHLAERGLEVNAGDPQEALAKLQQRKLKVEGEKVSRIAELQEMDALHGGGFVVLSEDRRQTMDTLGKLKQEGFEFVSFYHQGAPVSLSFPEAYDRVKFSDSDQTGNGFYVESPRGGSYRVKSPSSFALLHTLDGKGSATLPPEGEEAKKLTDSGIQVGIPGNYDLHYSQSPYGAFVNLQEQGALTDLRLGEKPLAVSTENRKQSVEKLLGWGKEESFKAFQPLTETMSYDAARQISPLLIDSSESLEQFTGHVERAQVLFDEMKSTTDRFLKAKKLPSGYLKALEEKIADSR